MSSWWFCQSLSGVFKYHWHALLTANLTILPGPLISLTRPKCLNKEGSSTLEQLYQFHVDYSNEEIDYNIFIGPESDHCLPLSLTHSLTNWLLFSKLYWCDPGVWRYQLKTCWCWNNKLNVCSDFEQKVCQDFEVEVQAKFEAGVWSVFFCWCFVEYWIQDESWSRFWS